MDPEIPIFGVPGYEQTPPHLQSDFEIIDETPQHSSRSKLTRKNMFSERVSQLSHGDNISDNTERQKHLTGNSPSQEPFFHTNRNNSTTATHVLNNGNTVESSPFSGQQNPLLSFSCSQLEAITKLVKCIKYEPSETADRALAEQMVNIAPQFDLRNINNSLQEFNIFFEINCIQREEVKFLILQGKLPWNTMVQFGEQYPDCGGKFNMLIQFLETNSPSVTPSMNFCKYINKFGEGSLFRDLYHSAVMASRLEKEELTKLFCYIFSQGSKRELLHEHMELPLKHCTDKVSRKWTKHNTQEGFGAPHHNKYTQQHTQQATSYNNQQTYPFTINAAVSNLCYYHQRFGLDAIKCMGPPCEKASLYTRKNVHRNNQGAKNVLPQV